MTVLTISNEGMEGIVKLIKYIKQTGLLIKAVGK